MKKIIFVILLAVVTSYSQNFSIEGHRGAKGWLPENTIPSFIKALELGADTVELDVVISADKQVVVSHEPWFNYIISLDPKGNPITAEKQKEHNIYKMKYAEVKKYDVGSLGHKDFPNQQKMKVSKPLLKDVFKAVSQYAKKHNLKNYRFNIEIKSENNGDNIYQPIPSIFAKLVYDEVIKNKMQDHAIIQSFDVRQLQELKNYPVKLPLALLVGNKDGIEKNIANLGFQPDTYSPHFSLVDENLVIYCQEKNIKLVPWTVNELADLEKMKKFKLDGIISDYPDRVVKVFKGN